MMKGMTKDWPRGFGLGLLATLAMTTVMALGMLSGRAPMPEPIPFAVVSSLFCRFPAPARMCLTGPAVRILGMGAHFLYGGAAGAVFMALFRRRSLLTGLSWGLALWLIMQTVFLPLVGWGFFGLAAAGGTPKIALATLALHLVYGGILGACAGRARR
jgi:hypothetical protein